MEYLNWCAEHPILALFALWAVAGVVAAPFKQKININVNDKDED